MKGLFKYIVQRTYKPLLVKYLSGTKMYSYKNIRIEVPPEVFHPGFFFSTRLLLKYISRLPLGGKTFLELGAGSGLISVYSALQGAKVTASDINPVSVKALKKNRSLNQTNFRILLSDLFENIPEEPFDIVAINPPYYKKRPVSNLDYAWYCGEEGEYFRVLFKGLQKYIHGTSEVLMVLCDGCDLEMIKGYAASNLLQMNCILSKSNLLEKNFIFRIEQV